MSDNVQDRDHLARHVEDCLSNFYNTAHLQTSPLRHLLALPDVDTETTARRLRELLRSVIEKLKPDSSVPFGGPEWLGYRVLQTRYIHNLSEIQTCEQLGISRSTYYRHRREALAAICDMLWELYYQRSTPSAAPLVRPEAARPPLPSVAEEAARLAHNVNPEWVDLEALIAEVHATVMPLASQRGIEIALHMPPSFPPFRHDVSLLRQILVSVLAEGIQRAAGKRLSLRVVPHPKGIHWELKPLLCPAENTAGGDPFALLEALLHLYGERPTLDADTSGRCALGFTLPAIQPTTILIVDNDEDMTRLYSLYLREGGFVTYEAHNAEEIKARLAESVPDLILLDILMPQTGGWSLLKDLRADARTANVPVIVCSVLSHTDLALALGANGVLQKPVSSHALLQAVREALGHRDSSA